MLRKFVKNTLILSVGALVLISITPGPLHLTRIRSLLVLIGTTTLIITSIAFLFKPRARTTKQKTEQNKVPF